MATKLEELVVVLTAETQGLRTELSKATKTTEDVSKKMESAISGMTQKGSKGFFSLGRAAETAAGFIGGQAVLGAIKGAASAAASFFQTIVVDGVKAAQVEEDAVNRLNTALKVSGRFTQAASSDLMAYAAQLQQTSKFGDETIISTMGLIQSMTRLDKEGLKGATQATADMAAAMGIDLNTAALTVSKALEGNAGALGRYGIKVEEGKTKAETFTNVMKALNDRFGGSAAAQVATFSGATTQLGNSWGDMTEVVGNAIIKNETIIAVINAVNGVISKLTGYLTANAGEMTEWVSKGVVFAANAFVKLIQILDYALIPIRLAVANIQNMGTILGAVGAATVEIANGNFKNAFDIMSTAAEENAVRTKDALTSAFNGESGLSGIIEVAKTVADAASASMDNLGRSTASVGENSSSAASAVRELTDAQKAQLEESLKLAEQLTLQNEMENAALENLKAKRAEDMDGILAYNELRIQTANDRHARELEGLQLALEEQKLTQEEHQLAVEQLGIRHNTNMAMIEKESAAEIDKIKEAQKQVDLKRYQEVLGAAQNSIGALASFQNSKNREMAAVGKAAAIAQTTIATYQGATQAFTALAPIPIVGPALGAAAAAAFIAQGLANVAQISGVGFRSGVESIPGIGTQDNFPAMLAPGEGVVDAKTNQKLVNFLDNGGGGGGTSYHITVQVQGNIFDRRETGLAIVEALNELNFSTGAAPA